MKAYKVLTIITIIILVGILGVIAFGGVYKLKDYKVRNVIPNYLFGKEFSKSRVVELTVDDSVKETKIYDQDGNEVTQQDEETEYTEENGYTTVETKVNPDEVLTKDNFEESKRIIMKRIKDLKIEQYTIKQNKENGAIYLDITENDDSTENISNLIAKGKFEMVDSETDEVLLDNTYIKNANVVYGQVDSTNTVVYLQIKFNKEGAKKLEEISKIYVETVVEKTPEEDEEETSETEKTEETEETEEESQTTTVTKEVSIYVDDTMIGNSTHFGDTLTGGILNVPIGSARDKGTLRRYIEAAGKVAILINDGILPITYVENDYINEKDINVFQNKIIVYSLIAISLLAFVFLIVKLKVKGILAGILEIGYISVLLLTVRYTNTIITPEGIAGISLSIIINYIFMYKSFNKIDAMFIKETTKDFSIKLIPIFIIAVVFTFGITANVSSFGMTLIWGLIIMYLYNLSLTQISIKTIQK